MVCIQCGGKTQTFNSRLQKRSNQVWRRRRCLACGAVFTTEEAALYTAAWAVEAKNGRLRPFSRDKLFLSLYKSCEHRPTATQDAGALTDTLIAKLVPLVNDGRLGSANIVQAAQVLLNRFDKAASVHYQAHHLG